MLHGNPGYRRKQGERGVAGIKMPCRNDAKNESIAGMGAARERIFWRAALWRDLLGRSRSGNAEVVRRACVGLCSGCASRLNQLDMITEAGCGWEVGARDRNRLPGRSVLSRSVLFSGRNPRACSPIVIEHRIHGHEYSSHANRSSDVKLIDPIVFTDSRGIFFQGSPSETSRWPSGNGGICAGQSVGLG